MAQVIVVPIDGSEPALRALDWAIEQTAGDPEARLIVVNVQNLALLDLGDAAAILPPGWETAAMDAAAQRVLDRATTHARRHGRDVVARSEHGPVGETIVKAAQELGARHIVMGTRGLDGVRSLMLGSVAFHVVHLSHVPVTLIK